MKLRAILLAILGLSQMAGDLFRLPKLRGVATATAASPAPKVFSTVRGLETFSTRFFIEWVDESETKREMPFSPEVYRRLRGPYNRRNVYGAVLAYGPLLRTNPLAAPMFEAIFTNSLCRDAPLLRELGITGTIRSPVLRLEPREGAPVVKLPMRLEPDCER